MINSLFINGQDGEINYNVLPSLEQFSEQYELIIDGLVQTKCEIENVCSKWVGLAFNGNNQREFFTNSFDFHIATLIMADNQLPSEVTKAYAHAVLEASNKISKTNRVIPYLNESAKQTSEKAMNRAKRNGECFRRLLAGELKKAVYIDIDDKYGLGSGTTNDAFTKWLKKNPKAKVMLQK